MSYPIVTGKSGRKFAAHVAGLIALIIDKQERFLMLSSPKRAGKWEPVNGAYDADETILDGLRREIREEAGTAIQIRPITAVHSYNFRYDEIVPKMMSIIFLFEYLGGEVIAGDDMAGSEIKWMSLEEINGGDYKIIAPSTQNWVYERAIKFYRLLKDETPVELQPSFDGTTNKYGE